MNKQIFVNLPVSDVALSKRFFSALGYRINLQFSTGDTACVVISEHIYAMLLEHSRFSQFSPKPVSDARQSCGVLLALSCESREEVDELVSRAVGAGGSTYNEAQDHGFMYQHGFQDPDGHIWEIMWMDPAFLEQQAEDAEKAQA